MGIPVWQYIGIVGHEAAKFTPAAEQDARRIIRILLRPGEMVLVSGGCHLGGIDLWAEEIYEQLRTESKEAFGHDRPDPLIYKPRQHNWTYGYKPRNLAIAQAAQVVHVIVVATYPKGFSGMKWGSDTEPHCYHCSRTGQHPGRHVKSGACWTAAQAQRMGKEAQWHIIPQ